MKLENQVCSLELAKKLKELGVKQESLFYWGKTLGKFEIIYFPGNLTKSDAEIGRVSAFTVAELGEMLAKYNKNRDFVVTNFDNEEDFEWICQIQRFDSDDYIGETFYAETEADARAKMLIYLIENKLV